MTSDTPDKDTLLKSVGRDRNITRHTTLGTLYKSTGSFHHDVLPYDIYSICDGFYKNDTHKCLVVSEL